VAIAVTTPPAAVSGGALASPGVVAASASVPGQQASGGAGVTLAGLSVAVTVPAAQAGASASIAAVTVTALFTAPQPAVRRDQAVTAVTVSATALFPVPAVAAVSGFTGTVTWTVQAAPPRWTAEPGPFRWHAQAAPSRWRTSPAPPRWAVSPALPRWRIIMTLFEPIAAISLEEVNVTWTSGLAGTSIDPTGATEGEPALPVEMAFPVSSGNPAEPAQPTVWFTASWLIGGTSTGYTAQCLVGPGGGVVTLTAGLSFDCWAKVLGSPEVPAKYAGALPVF